MNSIIRDMLFSGVTSSLAWYFYHDAIGITRRNSGFETSQAGTQVFPISYSASPTHHYVHCSGESKYYFRADDLSSIDQTFALRKSMSDGLPFNEGWSWVGEVGGEPQIILGSGGWYNEKKTILIAKSVSTVNLTLSGEQTINTVSCVAGDIVLARHQTDQKENGAYVVASGAWTRHTSADSTSDLQDLIVRIDTLVPTNVRYPYYQTTQNPVIGVDNIVFADYSWGDCQVFGGTVLPKDGGGYIMIYAANGPIVPGAYSIGAATSTDFETWTRTSSSPLLTGTSGGIHPRMVRIGSVLHLFVHNSNPLGTEGRLYRIMHFTSTWNDDPASWSFTKLSNDMLNGKGIMTEDCLGNMSDVWYENGLYYFISTLDAKWGYPANQGRVTQQSIQGTVTLFSTPDFSTFTNEGNIWSDSQFTGIGINALCGKMTQGGKSAYAIIDYKWQGKATLVTESEPFTNVKILTDQAPTHGELTNSNGEVFPLNISGFLRADQPQEASLSPIDVLSEAALTIVGSPARTYYSSIQPAANTYLYRTGNIITDATQFAVKVKYSAVTSDAATFPILWFGRASDSTEIFRLENFLSRYRVTVRDGSGLYKQYRTSTLTTALDSNPTINVDGLIELMFVWNNGTLTLGAIYNGSLTVGTITKDDSFTSLGMIGDELRIGVGADPSTEFCKYPVQSVVWMNGAYATMTNLINADVI